ncbi:MAG TPA: hypothetical protein VGP07_16635 [Polyangia bacterium]|jgi:hypothetical protein
MLKIDETFTAAGNLSALFLRVGEGGVLELVQDGEALTVSGDALDEVMQRFGMPFDPEEPVTSVASLTLDEERRLTHVRHLSGYDVIARDYLLYEVPGRAAVFALARNVAAALGHLARATSRAD